MSTRGSCLFAALTGCCCCVCARNQPRSSPDLALRYSFNSDATTQIADCVQ